MKNSLIYFGLILLFASAESHLNLYLNEHETMRLLGLSAELYYVRDGHINDYALHFTVPVPANVKEIAFTWQSLAGRPLPYRINITTSDPAVLPRPPMNISKIGEIPQEVQTFGIGLRCSGIRAAEVEVTILMEIILNRATNNVTALLFKRNKICLESEIKETTTDDITLSEHIEKSPSAMITLFVGCILALVLVAVLVSIAYCAKAPTKRPLSQPVRTSSFQRLATHSSSFTPSSLTPSICPTTTTTLPRCRSADPEELHRRISEITVQRCRVRLSGLLLEGTFGRLYRGTYNDNQEVLVKTVNPHASQMQVSMLLQEGMSLYGASHINILSVFGVSIEDHTAPILLYSGDNNMRNLKQFLHEPVARTLTTIQIVKMSLQLASAIGHLHTHGVLHKDIAARNCVIDDQFCVKLSDSSLSRDLFPQDYHCLGDRENRPIKWMSLEALTKKQFSEASDSWAFGVLIWELCTLARQPYTDIDAYEMESYLKDGYRLAQPNFCPDELFTIMAYCWTAQPIERPTFNQLQICLQEFYNQLTRYV